MSDPRKLIEETRSHASMTPEEEALCLALERALEVEAAIRGEWEMCRKALSASMEAQEKALEERDEINIEALNLLRRAEAAEAEVERLKGGW